MKKTKSVGGKEYGASTFAYVGDPQDTSTWHLPIPDEAHVRDALARFDQAQVPAADKAKVARKLIAAAKKYGIDASGFAKDYGVKEAAADVSYDDINAQIYAQLRDKFGNDASGFPRYYVVETFPTYVITRGPDGELYRIPYSFGDNDGDGDSDDVILGDPQEVEVAYVPVSESAQFIVEGAAEDDGYTWPVQIIQEGFAGGEVDGQSLPHYYSSATVSQFAEAANGARFGRRHPGPLEKEDDPDRIAGFFSEGKVVGKSAQAKLHLLKNETALRDKLVAMKEAGQNNLLGLSVLGYAEFKPGTIQGRKALISGKLAKLVSIDLVTEAGAGGKFLNPMRVAASAASSIAEIAEMQKRAIKPTTNNGSSNDASRQGANRMKQQIMKLLEALRERNAARATELTSEFNALKDEQHADFLVKVSEALASEPAKAAAAAAGAAAPTEGGDVKKVQEMLARAEKLDAKNRLESKLGTSKLPQPAMALVREHLSAQTPTDEQIDAEIKSVREAFAAFTNVGKVNSTGVVVTGRDTQDKMVLAVEGMFGVREALKSGVKPFRGIREAYQTITGDFDCSRVAEGYLYRVTEAIATTDFPNILLNSMTKRLLQDYAEVGMGGLDRVITTANIADYKSNDRVRMGYLGDIPIVAESAVYTELTKPTDEKISYAVAKHGGTLTISEETIKNDDLGKIAQFPNRLARAGRRTLKQFITSLFTANANYDPDSVAIFNAAHNNLTVNVLSSANMDAAELLLLNQSEKDSSKPLNLPLQWLMVPPALKATAFQINNNNSGTNNWFERLGSNHANPENLIVNELLTASSTTRWYAGCFPAEAPAIEIGFLDGIQEPQIFLASQPTVGLTFTNDQIVYKVKFVFSGKFVDFRPVTQNN